jgi:hypothetical protein
MSSIPTAFSQRKSNKLVVTQDVSQGEQGPYFFSQADIDNWYASHSSDVNKVTNSLYIIRSADFVTTIGDLAHSLPALQYRKTLTDLGKSVYFGNKVNTDLLVLQKVQAYGPVVNGGNGSYVGYVVVENNALELQTINGRFLVRCARI